MVVSKMGRCVVRACVFHWVADKRQEKGSSERQTRAEASTSVRHGR